MITVNDENEDWTIYVSGTVSGNASQHSTIVIDGTVQAKALVIEGSGTNATLTAANTKILVIEPSGTSNPPPVTLKNLTITDSSSGIWVSSPTQVTITDCTIKDMDSDAASIGLRVGNPDSVVTLNGSTKISNCILRNNTNDCGVVFIAGTLIMKDNACIENNEDASGVANSGGGVTVCGGNVFLCGNATIKNNSSMHGGGIYAYDGAKLYIGYTRNTDGKPIAYDNFTGGIFDNTASGAGGGIYLSSSTNDGYAFTCLMHAGSIKGNTANMGGGISLSGTPTTNDIFIMNGGTIADNTATAGGGAILVHNRSFTIKGKASIPCGSNNTNDVLLSEKRIITIEDELVNHNEGNPIALTLGELENDSAAANGRVVATGVANQSNKFKLLNGYYKLVEETNNNDSRDYKLAMDISKVTEEQIRKVLSGGEGVSETDNTNQDILNYFSGPKTQRLFLQFSDDDDNLIDFYTAFELVFDGRSSITYSHSTTRNSTPNSLTNKTFTFDDSNQWYLVDFDGDGTDDISIHWNDNAIWIGQEYVKYYIFN